MSRALAEAMRRMMNEILPARQRAALALRPKLSYEHHLDRLLRIYVGATLVSSISNKQQGDTSVSPT
jgi:hypothetical protein